MAAVGFQRRLLQLARDFASRRVAFGKTLAQHALHASTLAEMEVKSRACLHFVLEMSLLLGKAEGRGDHKDDNALLLRLLTPVCKLFTAKLGVEIAAESLESFGGYGYVEDSGIPTIYRDMQVLSIWEGTTNVLSIDVLRVLSQKNDRNAIRVFREAVYCNLSGVGKKLTDPSAGLYIISSVVAQI